LSETGANSAPTASGMQAGAGEASHAQQPCSLAPGDLGPVVDGLQRLDGKQLRQLVEELRLALLDAMPASDAGTDEDAKGSFAHAPRDLQRDETIAPTAATSSPMPVMPADTVTARSEAPNTSSKSRPRRIGFVLASGCLATVAASLLFVPAAGPPLEVGAIGPQAGQVEPARTPEAVQVVDIGASGNVVPQAAEASPVLGQSNPSTNGPAAPERTDIDRQAAMDVPPAPSSEPRPEVVITLPPAPPSNPPVLSEPAEEVPTSARDEPRAEVDASPASTPSVDPRTGSEAYAVLEPSAGAGSDAAVDMVLDPTPSAGAGDKSGPATAAPPVASIEPGGRASSLALLEPEVVRPPAPAPAADPLPATASPSLPPEIIEALMERGDRLLGLGDIASARMLYERAAEAGNPGAATGVARTFDPLFLKQIGAVGIRGDRAKAISWYRRASEGGDQAAEERLNSLLSESSNSALPLHRR